MMNSWFRSYRGGVFLCAVTQILQVIQTLSLEGEENGFESYMDYQVSQLSM